MISIKIAAKVVQKLHENRLYEMTPEFSKVASILAVIPSTLSSAEHLFNGLRRLKTFFRILSAFMTLKSLANSMDKIINIFGQRPGKKKKTFYFNITSFYFQQDRVKLSIEVIEYARFQNNCFWYYNSFYVHSLILSPAIFQW